LKKRYVEILKIGSGAALIIGAAMIMLPDFVRLFSSLGRILLLVIAIVAIAFLFAFLSHHLKKRAQSAAHQDPSEAKENVSQ
jgi:VIT1/CCC1 family predicted Fe2+/Mn2+ transporter